MIVKTLESVPALGLRAGAVADIERWKAELLIAQKKAIPITRNEDAERAVKWSTRSN